MIGRRLGPYEITAKLGEGGMGEVHRATDSRLRREVAIKVLPEALATDPERLSRFEREAQLLAQLQHPHIASIYGLEESGEQPALVMELVEGPTLDERMAEGALGIEESLAIARQIADALEAAHDKGIIHRDLKPQNVKIAPEGTVKVLDFGLAKALDPLDAASGEGSASRLAASPTLTLGATAQGVLLGTAGYMSPEQAKGVPVDKRADIWAFGVVLWEMLTGGRLFTGETGPETLAGVLKSTIDLDALPSETPPAIRRLLRRCLERNPKNRLHDIADARLVLDDVAAGVADPEPASASDPVGWRPTGWIGWALATVLAVALVVVFWRSAPEPAPSRVVRSTLPLPEGLSVELDGDRAGMPALSPDGTRIAFGGREGAGPLAIWVVELATGEARRLDGTEGASRPFWSPDGQEIGFFTWYALSTIPAKGGPVTRLAPCRDARGGSWSPNGTLLYAPHAVGPLWTVSAQGGNARPETGALGEVDGTHRFPQFLPDGEHFLYLNRRARAGEGEEPYVALGRLGSGESRPLLELATNAAYADGYLLYVRDDTLVAQPFDPDRQELSGSARPLIADLLHNRRFTFGVFSASENGVLAFLTGQHSELSQLVWRDRNGARLGTMGSPGILSGVGSPAVSPDGAWAASPKADPVTGSSDLWLYDLLRGTETRLARSGGDELNPLFSPDSRVLYYASTNRNFENWSLRRRELESGAEEALYSESEWLAPDSLSPDGRTFVLSRLQVQTFTTDLFLWNPEDDSPRELLVGPQDQSAGQISPDGRWLAWSADESGRHEVYVGALPDLASRVQVTRDGGTQPRWGPDGSELFFLDPDNWLTSIPLQTVSGAVSVGTPKRLFQITEFWTWPYTVGPDGTRFLVRERLEESDTSPLTLLTDWTALLEGR